MQPYSPSPLLVISLANSVDRRTRMEAQLNSFTTFDWRFVNAVDGRLLPTSALMTLCQSFEWSRNSKGTIGCFLSHVKCWEIVRDSGKPYSIVLEDDSIIPTLDQVHTIDIPDSFDLVFLNERMSLPITDSRHECYPVIRGIIGHSRQDRFWGPGADGYLISAKGAAKLLDAVKTDLFYGNVDGRLVRYCSHQDDAKQLPDDSRMKRIIIENHHPRIVPQSSILEAYVVSPPLVRAGGFPSVRE
jgi:GR25 family glycosyltransferase involved in LPS biosynthesis